MSNPSKDTSSKATQPSMLSSFLSSQTDDEDIQMKSPTREEGPPLPPAPSSLLASALPPSLLAGNISTASSAGASSALASTTLNATTNISIPPRPRRLWNVQDNRLKPIPQYYPPLDPRCTALVTDVPPSLVAIRITECLRKRSIAAEYDEDSITAWCMTVDRTHFTIQLYRGNTPNSISSTNTSSSCTMDFTALSSSSLSPPVVVECQRQSGNVVSFHAACYALLQAAKGIDTGNDDRELPSTNSMEFQSSSSSTKNKRRKLVHVNQRYSSNTNSNSSPNTVTNPAMTAETAYEGARELLQKDRLECQQLGMERLVNLTSHDVVCSEVSRYVSRRILQEDWLIDTFLMHPEAEQAMEAIRGNSGRGNKKKGNDNKNDSTTALIRTFLESSAAIKNPMPKMSFSTEDRSSSSAPGELSPDELRHEAQLRSLALRILCNAMSNLSSSGELQSLLNTNTRNRNTKTSSKRNCRGSAVKNVTDSEPSRLVQPPFLLSLVQDMQGASRPPSVSETGYKLSSVHEAALAIRCLRLLAASTSDDEQQHYESSDEAPASPQALVRDFLRNDVVLECLEMARSCGRATHNVLQQEAESTYIQLTEDARSC